MLDLMWIAWKSIRQRGVASVLTMLSMALGVMMVVAVLTIHGVVTRSFEANKSLGYNMLVGAKGGKLQLTLNTVYYLSQPVENIPYDYYLEFAPAERRAAEYQHSLRHAREEAQAAALALAADPLGADLSALGRVAGEQALNQTYAKAHDLTRDGKYALFTQLAIPLCLGDYFGKFRVVGTIPGMFDDMVFDPISQEKFKFAQGRNFKLYDEKNTYFEAVVGATVAREMNVKLGATINPTHGDPEGHAHGQGFTVVGILAPTGTPNDRAVFVNMEGFYLMDDHAKPLEQGEADEDAPRDDETKDEAAAGYEPLVIEQREITAMLVRTANPFVAIGLENTINEGNVAQAVSPIKEITSLLDLIVTPVQQLLLVLTAMICFVSGISILVSIYNSMNDRRRDIAVMRALGASRGTVFGIILAESIILSLGGGLLGSVAGHTLNAAFSQQVEDRTGVTVGFASFAPGPRISTLLGTSPEKLPLDFELSLEFVLLPIMLSLAVVVGLWPAWEAYRTDVSRSLG